jgi:hypothetical protein
MVAPATISLLHATHAAGEKAVSVRNRWFALAARPDLLEHDFAFDADDLMSADVPEIAKTGGLPPLGGRVTAVRNWNHAASKATGDLLMVIADDLTPSLMGWDEALRAKCGLLDPTRVPFAMKVRDGSRASEHLMRHPIVSREFWTRFGLLDPGYYGIGVDNDFTNQAHCEGLVIDARDAVFEHVHPHSGAPESASHSKMSSEIEAKFGKERFAQRWPVWKRRLLIRYFVPCPGQRSVSETRRIIRGVFARLGRLSVIVPAALRHRISGHLGG